MTSTADDSSTNASTSRGQCACSGGGAGGGGEGKAERQKGGRVDGSEQQGEGSGEEDATVGKRAGRSAPCRGSPRRPAACWRRGPSTRSWSSRGRGGVRRGTPAPAPRSTRVTTRAAAGAAAAGAAAVAGARATAAWAASLIDGTIALLLLIQAVDCLQKSQEGQEPFAAGLLGAYNYPCSVRWLFLNENKLGWKTRQVDKSASRSFSPTFAWQMPYDATTPFSIIMSHDRGEPSRQGSYSLALWSSPEVQRDALKCLYHPIVQGIAQGPLPR